jgi:hypothetical protein
MDRRTVASALHAALLWACALTLVGHLCVPLHAAHHGTEAGPSLAGAPEELAHPASCEAIPGSPVRCPGVLAVETRIPTMDVRTAEAAAALDSPAPILRPPRFLLHATLLN